jgi:DMSO/TMAO reductase YedYZ molybdopterin-dependent catalytic subunit
MKLKIMHSNKKTAGLLLSIICLLALTACSASATTTTVSSPTVPVEVEATEFMGTQLTPISEQNNNALAGTQNIDRKTYTLTIDGLAELMPLDCVEGWNFTAKWTGPSLTDIFAQAKVQSAAKIAIFYTADAPEGYTSLDISYIEQRNIIIALKNNDITLPDDRGFPFQVVAESKYGYKWAKWVTRIELSDNTDFRGYWEGYGYNNNAEVGGPAFESP